MIDVLYQWNNFKKNWRTNRPHCCHFIDLKLVQDCHQFFFVYFPATHKSSPKLWLLSTRKTIAWKITGKQQNNQVFLIQMYRTTCNDVLMFYNLSNSENSHLKVKKVYLINQLSVNSILQNCNVLNTHVSTKIDERNRKLLWA